MLTMNAPIAVLKLAAEKAGWGRKLPRGRGMGIALGVGFDSYCAEVVEVSVRAGKLRVERIVCAFDCGMVVDPRNVEAQVEGGIVWGLSAARDRPDASSIRVRPRRRISTEGRSCGCSEMPDIEVHLVKSDQKPGGCGEASVPPVAPALASAIFAATGQRVRRLPLTESGYF